MNIINEFGKQYVVQSLTSIFVCFHLHLRNDTLFLKVLTLTSMKRAVSSWKSKLPWTPLTLSFVVMIVDNVVLRPPRLTL